MKSTRLMCIIAVLGLATAALGAGPVATPGPVAKDLRPAAPALADKAFGDPTDLLAGATAGADLIRRMQADITEDNAGNGATDADPDDGGWDWDSTIFEHSASGSYSNLAGVIANAVFDVYDLTGDPGLRTVLDDVASQQLNVGPAPAYPVGLHYAGDILFLLRYADLPDVVNKSDYRNAAAAVWAWRLANTGTGTAASVAEAIRDGRAGQYPNGIIPWDIGQYVEAVSLLHAAFPGMGYDADAAAMAEVVWQDSFNGGYFDVNGTEKNAVDDYSVVDYWWYTLGVTGLVQAFASSGTHTAELPLLESLLLECQYPDGAFSFQYGADPNFNDRDWQTTAYAARTLAKFLPGHDEDLYLTGTWLGATQDGSGAFIYDDLSYNLEETAECAGALAAAYAAGAASVDVTSFFNDPTPCGAVADISFGYDRADGTPGLFGYELVIDITGPISTPATTDFIAVAPMDYFRVDENLDGTFTVNATRFGADPGLLADAELFYIDNLTSLGDGIVTVDVLSYRMRDPQNVPIFAAMNGLELTVDCTAPAAVTGITAEPGHNKVQVGWTHDGTDTITYEIYRGLWYDGAVGVSAYPEYDDLPGTIPGRPSDRDVALASPEWVLAGTVAVGTTSFTDTWPDASSRGVYYYEVFAVDGAINGSLAAPANDRATNYWLGDVDPIDGEVGVDDINALGTAFTTSHGDPGYDNAIDVGPTDDWSGTGIPLTDSRIDFEDLMIFALNFGVVTPAKSMPASGPIELAWTVREDGRMALNLVAGNGLKGVRVRADAAVAGVEAGALLAGQAGLPFLVNPGERLDVNLALMGRGVDIVGSGELFVVDAPQAIAAAALAIEVRGVDNAELEFTLDKAAGAALPTAFALRANYPNPFNPSTTISFALPVAQDVELAVYSLDGRRVATLLSERRTAGVHQVVWDGRDASGRSVSSGLYLYRIDAGPYSQVRKMTLMK